MNFNLTAVSRPVAKAVLLAKKNGPTIAFVGGTVGAVTSTVLACRATLKLAEDLPEMRDNLAEARKPTELGETERTKDVAYVYSRNALHVAKLYAPSVIIGVASVTALTGSHVAMSRRNAGLTAAYAAVSEALSQYRDRVRDELGDDRETELYRGISHKKVKLDGDDKKSTVAVFDPTGRSAYGRIFDACSPNWTKSPEYNKMFLMNQQEYLNEKLRIYGYVLLNDAYEALGFERTAAGAVVGWAITDEGTGDNFIDLGIFEAYNSEFVNGMERSCLLDFNVDGVVYDKI